MWGWISIERAGQDVRYAVRMMRRKPGFALAAILTLMLGIGGNTAMFSLMNALLMRTLPVDRPDELVRLIEEGRDPSAPQEVFTLVTQDTLQGQTRALSGVLASSMVGVRPNEIEVGSEKRPVFLQFVSDNYFDVLGIRAFRGRAFTQPDPGSPREPIAVISHEYWQRQFAADPSAIGARFQLRSGHEFTIAGIAPPGFGGTELDVPAEIWVAVEHTVPPGDADRVRGRCASWAAFSPAQRWMITRVVSSLLFGLSPRDPVTIIAALTALTLATIAAAYVPAKRAASIDPIFALREE